MREKVIDIALIVTLIVVAFGITWTLLTLNRDQSRPVDRQPQAEQNTRSNTAISPIPIDPLPADEAEDQPAESGAGQPEPEQPTAQEEPQPQVADPDPVPPGPVQIGRVGFSFVTGGAGACGVTLEPWRHVAVSRELLAAYGCGAEVTISLEEAKGGREEFEAVIGDTMNPSFSRPVNIYVSQDEPALEYGVTSGVLRP